MKKLHNTLLFISILMVSSISFSQISIGGYSELFSGKFLEKNSFETTKNHLTLGGGILFGFELPKKIQLNIGIGYNRYTNVYENSTLESNVGFKNENYETKTVLNTTLNGFYYVDFLRFDLAVQYPIIKFKDKLSITSKLGFSASLNKGGYEEFHIEGTEKGKLFYQDSIYDIDNVNKGFFVNQKPSFEYANSINLEILAGIGSQYRITKNHSVFVSLDYYFGLFNSYYFNDRYQHYTNSNDVVKSRAMGLKIGYSYRFDLTKKTKGL